MWEARNAKWEAKQLERKQREEAAAAAGQPVPRQRQRQRRRRKKTSAEQGGGKGGKGGAGEEGAAEQVRFRGLFPSPFPFPFPCPFPVSHNAFGHSYPSHTHALLSSLSLARALSRFCSSLSPFRSPSFTHSRTPRSGPRAKEAVEKDQLQSLSESLRGLRGLGGRGREREEEEDVVVVRCCSAAGRWSRSRGVVVVDGMTRRLSHAERDRAVVVCGARVYTIFSKRTYLYYEFLSLVVQRDV